MNGARILLLPSRFLKAIFFFVLLYFFSNNFLYRRVSRFYEKWVRSFSKATLNALQITLNTQMNRSAPLPGQAIFICNHSSSFEIFMMPYLLAKTHFIMTVEGLKVPFLGKIFQKAPVIFLKGQSRKALCEHLNTVRQKLVEGRNIMLFPEGRSFKTIGPRFEKGAFQFSYEMGIPIVPIYLHYEELDAFVPDDVVNHKKEFFRILKAPNKKITAHFFEDISPNQFSNVIEFRDSVYQQYCVWQKQFYGC